MTVQMYKPGLSDSAVSMDEASMKKLDQNGITFEQQLKNSGYIFGTPPVASTTSKMADNILGSGSGTGSSNGSGSSGLDTTTQKLIDSITAATSDVSTSNTDFESTLRTQAQQLANERRQQIQSAAELDMNNETLAGNARTGGVKAQLGVGLEGAPGLSTAEIGLIDQEIKLTEKNLNEIKARRDKALLDSDTTLYTQLSESYRNEEQRQETLRQARFTRLTTALSAVTTLAKDKQTQANTTADNARQLILGLAGAVSTDFFTSLSTDEQKSISEGNIPWSAISRLNNAKLNQAQQLAANKLKESTAQFVVNNLGSFDKASATDIASLAQTLNITPETLKTAIASKAALDVAKLQADIQKNNPTFIVNVPTAGDVTGQRKDTTGSDKNTMQAFYVGGNLAGYVVKGSNGLIDHYEDMSGNKIAQPPANATFSSSKGSIFDTLLLNANGGTTPAPTRTDGKIQVKLNDNRTGWILPSEFDAKTMTKL